MNASCAGRALVLGFIVSWLFLLVPATSARDLGVDVSHFQGETGMPQANWN